MDLARLDEIKTIDARPLLPWRAESFTEIEIGSDREMGRERAEAVRFASAIVVYSDASGRESHTVFKVNHQQPRTEHNGTTRATILCDSRSALQAIQNPGNKSGQRIIHAIL